MNELSPNSNKESSKTPGGISKSLLTPCRRVGLSRKWKKSGSSPFISPLSTQNPTPERTELEEENKRNISNDNEHDETNIEVAKKQLNNLHGPCNENDITSTPSRNTQIQRRKSKVLPLSLKTNQVVEDDKIPRDKQLKPNKLFNIDEPKPNVINKINAKTVSTKCHEELEETQEIIQVEAIQHKPEINVVKLAKTKSKSKKLSLKKSSSGELNTQHNNSSHILVPKENKPNNLTKECIVVIQNKILNNNPHVAGNESKMTLQESDSEPDLPLSVLKRKSFESTTVNTLEDNDFITIPVKKKLRNLSTIKRNKTTPNHTESSNSSQSSQEDISNRTILVKKTYDKVIKPQKAKSTGSITQKDIDDLKARIEMKKKILLAKSMSIDTEELRDLIKKWQKGCQDALMELLDLMKKKLPDRQNMDYAEILETLKIPPELVGYDSENDCFNTPDDTNILLSAFKL